MMWHTRTSPKLQAAALFLLAEMLVGCSLFHEGAGPAVWIDRPLTGDEVPMSQALIIQAHASDADGVGSFEFFVFDTPLGIVMATGERLGEASLQWQPPAPGIFRLGVRAQDTLGNQGAMSSVQITVAGTVQGTTVPTQAPASDLCAQEALVAPALVSPADGSSVEAELQLAWSYPDTTCHPFSYAIDISPDAAFTDNSHGFGTVDYNETSRVWSLPTGQCYYWRARAYVPDSYGPASTIWKFCLANATEVVTTPIVTLTQNANCRSGPGTAYESVDILMQGQTATLEGRNAEDTWFWVKRTSGGHCWISIVVGDLAGDWGTLPIIAAEPLPVTETPPEPADTTPPVISDLTVTPGLISVQTQCGATPAVTIISARVDDDSGIQRVVARVSGWGEFDMSLVGGNLYQASLGPFSESGTLSVFVQAWDSLSNGALAGPATFQVVDCPG